MASLGTHPSYRISTSVSVSVTNVDNNTARVTFSYSAATGSQTSVQSSGVKVKSTCNNSVKGPDAIVGCRSDGVWQGSGNTYYVTHTYDYTRTTSPQTLSYKAEALTQNSASIGSTSGTVTIDALPTGSFNLNILLPDGSEPYMTGAAGTVEFSSDGGSSYSTVYNEPAGSYTINTVFRFRNFRPASGLAFDHVEGATDLGGGVYGVTQTTSSVNVSFHTKYAYTKCGTPTNLSITDNDDNTLTIKGTVGSDGIQNASTGIRIFGTYNSENIPTTSKYDFTFTLKGATGTELTTTYGPIMINSLSGEYNSTINIIAYTIGTVSGYDSDISSIASGAFKYYNEPGTPVIIRPSIDMTHAPHNFTLEWEQPSGGINNPIEGYTVSLECISPEYELITAVSINDPEICGYEFKSYLFEFDKQYQFRVQALGTNSNFNSESGLSSILSIIDLQPFNNLNFKPSCRDDIKFFNNKDSYTNVLHIPSDIKRWLLMISWDEPEGINNLISNFNISLIDDQDTEVNNWYGPSDCSGLSISNEHILRESIQSLYKEYKLRVHTKSIYTDDYVNYDNISEFTFRVYPASGMYINTENEIKRAIGFKKLEDGSWIPLRELYQNIGDNNWVKSIIDIAEIDTTIVKLLTDINNNVIIDNNDQILVT